MKHIIREVEPECMDLNDYFDGDWNTEKSGNYGCYIFIVCSERWNRISGLNIEEYKRIMEIADNILDGFNDVEDGILDYDGKRYTYKRIMEDYGIAYNSTKAHKLRKWAEDADTNKTETMAEFLTIYTGKRWEVEAARGYSQGDYVEVVYCPEFTTKECAEACGEVWLGAAKEFVVIDLDEDGNEADSCFGYIVADCQAWRDEDYKRLVCDWAGIEESDTQLEMIDGSHMYTKYSYRVV